MMLSLYCYSIQYPPVEDVAVLAALPELDALVAEGGVVRAEGPGQVHPGHLLRLIIILCRDKAGVGE